METLAKYFPFIIFGLMMFMMFKRGGCCGGHSHQGNTQGHTDHSQGSKHESKRCCETSEVKQEKVK